MFTVDEWTEDEDISKAMARTIARYNTLDVPVRKTPVDLVQIFKDTHAKHKALMAKGLPPLPPTVSEQHAKAQQDLINFDLTAEAEWFGSVMPKIPSRIVFIHSDVNRGNTLCRLQEYDSGRKLTWDERIVLVDYEFSAYDRRGFEIGK